MLVTLCLAAGWPALAAYAREPAPVFRLLADMQRATAPFDGGARRTGDVVVAMHRRPFVETARPRAWVGAAGFPWRLLPAPTGHEWLELVKYWHGGGTARTWFLADVRRTDLALIDPASQHPNGHYEWSTPLAAGVLGGTRPGALDWVVIDGPPGWFLGEGLGALARDRRRRGRRPQGPRSAGRRGRLGAAARPAPAPGDRRPQPGWRRAPRRRVSR